MPLTIRQIPCLQDNYAYLIRDDATGAVASIDAPDAAVLTKVLEDEGWTLTHILNTHHHWDHAGGNLALKERWGCEIVAPAGEQEKIPGVDRTLREGDSVMLGESRALVVETPGHTNGHIVYHFEDDGCAFVGDAIFAMGCGRLFEGTPADMWTSLSKIAAWPPETKLYCAHEYTQTNARFSLT
ncbi:MAG: hydroxyacylglutathione hydrolase, partial [Pseudomonadota bacterium]